MSTLHFLERRPFTESQLAATTGKIQVMFREARADAEQVARVVGASTSRTLRNVERLLAEFAD